MNKYLTGLILGVVIPFNSALSAQCAFDFPHFMITNSADLGLYLGKNGHWWYPCNMSSAKNDTTVHACKAAYATVMTAKVSNKPMTFYWPGTCDEISNPTQSISDRGFRWMAIYDL